MQDERELETLKLENAELRAKLAKATADAERYHASNNELLNEIFPYVPPTEEELREMMVPDPSGETLADILDGFRRELEGQA